MEGKYCDRINWIRLAPDGFLWQIFVTAVMNRGV
jgi:hypothetical protein